MIETGAGSSRSPSDPPSLDAPGARRIAPATAAVSDAAGRGDAPEAHLSVWRAGGLVDSDGVEGLPEALADEEAHVWIDLLHATPEVIGEIARILGLHPLLAEDIAERNQRAKSEVVEGVVHLVLFSLAWDGDRLFDRELDFVLGRRFLLSSHSRHWEPRRTHHLHMGCGELLAAGPDKLLWALADDVVDGYFPVLDRLGDEIDDLQDRVVTKADSTTLARLFELKRDLISIRRVTAPEREIFNLLTDRDIGVVRPAQVLYFRDLYDHLIRLSDELDNDRDLVSGTLDVYLSTVNNNLSVIMKRLTGVTVILSGVAAIGGLFGMSEAGAAFNGAESIGFWIVVAATIAAAAGAAVFLRHIDWI